jgi:hypothetical protein
MFNFATYKMKQTGWRPLTWGLQPVCKTEPVCRDRPWETGRNGIQRSTQGFSRQTILLDNMRRFRCRPLQNVSSASSLTGPEHKELPLLCCGPASSSQKKTRQGWAMPKANGMPVNEDTGGNGPRRCDVVPPGAPVFLRAPPNAPQPTARTKARPILHNPLDNAV